MVDNRDKKKFEILTTRLALEPSSEVRGAVVGLCRAMVRLSVTPADRIEEARADLSAAAHQLERRISREMSHSQAREVRRGFPAFYSDLKIGATQRQLNICAAVRDHANDIWTSHGIPSMKRAKA